VATLGILKEKGVGLCLLIIAIRIRTSNKITKFDMVIDWKLNCLVNGLFLIRRMNDILNNACRIGILRMILLYFEMFEFGVSCDIKYCHIVGLGFR